jgi:hypothetical protein
MNRYLNMLIVAIILAVWIPVTLAPWIIVGPWNLANKLRSRLWLTN